MSTRYFILQKPIGNRVTDESKNQIIVTAPTTNYILPMNNLVHYVKHGLFEKNLIEWCKQFGNKEKTFLDIGAHSGTYTLSLANHFRDVHAFEPQRATFYSLCGSVALSELSTVECHRIGLGSEDQVGRKKLNIVSEDGGGSSIHVTGNKIIAEEWIDIQTLDSFGLDSIGFIKMDVEDNELFVLKGAVETIKRSGYPRILFESNSTNPPLFEFLQGLGYTVIGISGVNNMFLAHKA